MHNKFSILLIGILVTGCGLLSEESEPAKDLSDIQVKDFAISELPYLEMPYIREYVRSMSMDAFDEDSVPMYVYDGTPYYHPVYISALGISFVDGYVRTEDPDYLKLSRRIAERLVLNAAEKNDKFLFPYNFDYTYSSGDFLKSPWYSGMAQGRILTFFTRLYNATGDSIYSEWAANTYESLKLLKGQEEEWISMIDEEGYFWIEEYTIDDPVHVLNGFIFATFGLYDYYLMSRDEEVLTLLQACITTIERYIADYRNPGGMSFYDLNDKPTKEFYHGVHISQLNLLYKITGEQYFKTMADSLESDHPIPQ